jgi:hypothetical protein
MEDVANIVCGAALRLALDNGETDHWWHWYRRPLVQGLNESTAENSNSARAWGSNTLMMMRNFETYGY